MKTERNLILICLLGVLLPTAMQAQFTFVTNNGAITITGYAGTNDAVIIPSTTNGYPVTGIGPEAFAGSSLTIITVPDSIISIGSNAFAGSSLNNISLSRNIVCIEAEMFYDCTNLRTF